MRDDIRRAFDEMTDAPHPADEPDPDPAAHPTPTPSSPAQSCPH